MPIFPEFFKKIKIEYIFWFCFFWTFLTVLNLHFLIDGEYKRMFFDAQSLGVSKSIMQMNFAKDPSYFLLQNISASFVGFSIFFAILIFICLMLKLIALLQVNPAPTLFDIAPYFLVLGFLHEGIQIRIALALSIVLLSIILFAKSRYFWATILLVIASTFHISVLTFALVFFLVFLYEKFGKSIIIGGVLLCAFLAYTPFIPEMVSYVGGLTSARFLAYSGKDFIKIQNSSGLFEFYVFFVGFLVIIVYRMYQPVSTVWRRLYQIAVASGLLAIAILQVFRFSVVVSSRLADLLLLPVLIVLGAMLNQLKAEKRYIYLWGVIILLLSYCLARGYVSFHPGSKLL